MTEREIQVVNLLVEQNVALEDSAVCGEKIGRAHV